MFIDEKTTSILKEISDSELLAIIFERNKKNPLQIFLQRVLYNIFLGLISIILLKKLNKKILVWYFENLNALFLLDFQLFLCLLKNEWTP